MKELLCAFTAYNVWANRKLIDALAGVPPTLLDEPMGGSFATIRKTIYHIWDAQVIWLTRLQGASPASWPSASYGDDFSGYDVYFLQQSEDFDRFVSTRPDSYFEDMCFYRNLNGDSLKTRNGDIILHCMNHSTYHRGQVITFLRQSGIQDVPHTDYLIYLRDLS